MTCEACGQTSAAMSAFCTYCGRSQSLRAAAATAGGSVGSTGYIAQPVTDSIRFTSDSGTVAASRYAPFFSRFIAFLLDQFLAVALGALTYLLIAAVAAAFGASTVRNTGYSNYGTGVGLGGSFVLLFFGSLLAFAAYVWYFVKQETGPRQATLGKSLLGIRITTMSGGTISIGQSIGRLIVKDTLSGLFFALGFIMAAFTERKQALHDLVAGTIVVLR